MHSSRALLLGLLLFASALAGCAGRGGPVETGGDILPPAGTTPAQNAPTAHFQIAQLAILAADGSARALYEDDAEALVRYVVAQPADAPRAETAFITYLLNGRIVDVQQQKLAPGEEKTFERKVLGLRDMTNVRVEVRAASAVAKAEATVLSWPRAGDGELKVGPLAIRVPYGLMEQDGRVLVNLTVAHNGSEEPFRDFRVKMLCLTSEGAVQATTSVRLAVPPAGETTGVDAVVDNCQHGFYGLEFKAEGPAGDLFGRMLLVSRDWRPPQA